MHPVHPIKLTRDLNVRNKSGAETEQETERKGWHAVAKTKARTQSVQVVMPSSSSQELFGSDFASE